MSHTLIPILYSLEVEPVKPVFFLILAAVLVGLVIAVIIIFGIFYLTGTVVFRITEKIKRH